MTQAYPAPLSPTVYDVSVLGVGQGTESVTSLSSQSVALQLRLSRVSVDLGRLRQEPAISGLDWLFTPIRRSEEGLLALPLQASTPCNRRFTLPTNSSTGFGSCPGDWRRYSHLVPHNVADVCFRYGYPRVVVILAT